MENRPCVRIERVLRLSNLGLLLAAVAAALTSLPAHGGATLERIHRTGTVVIGHREAAMPFSYMNADNRPAGYAVEICERLVTALQRRLQLPGLKPSYVQVGIADRIPALVEGRVDLECGSTSNTAERREKVAFTIPHFVTGTRYLVRSDSPIEQVHQFQGKKLVSTRGSAALQSVRKINDDFKLGILVLEAAEHRQAVDMVVDGTADGFAMDEILLYSLIAGRPDAARLKVVGRYLTVEPLAIAMNRGDAEFRQLVDEEMRRLIFSRDVHRLYDRWFQQPIPPDGINLRVPMNQLLREYWKYPTSYVP